MKLLATVTTLFALTALAAPAGAQSNPRYVQFQPRAVKGALYVPDAGPAPHVGILALHRTSNYLGYHGCRELSRRGYMVLCMNPRSDNNEALVRWEANALDVKTGMSFLRSQPGITKVVLYGFSGGGAATSFYQAVAEAGIGYCSSAAKLVKCGNELAGLPRADGIILVDTNPGNAASALRRLNGAVTNDKAMLERGEPAQIDPTLDPFNPANGYNPKGGSHYSDAFAARYFAAQTARMNQLIEVAQARLQAIESGHGRFTDDDVFLLARADTAELMLLDPSIHHTTRASAEGPEERWLGGGAGGGKRAGGAAGAGGAEPIVRAGHAAADAPFVPERQRHPLAPRHGRRGLVLDQQLRAVRRAVHLGADADRGDGRQQLPEVQRDPLRPGQEPGQGLHRRRRREPRSDAVRAVRDHTRAVRATP